MFSNKHLEIEPMVINRTEDIKGKIDFPIEQLDGKWWRIYPHSWHEVHALQMLNHREDKYAPEKGHGVIISDRVYQQLCQRP